MLTVPGRARGAGAGDGAANAIATPPGTLRITVSVNSHRRSVAEPIRGVPMQCRLAHDAAAERAHLGVLAGESAPGRPPGPCVDVVEQLRGVDPTGRRRVLEQPLQPGL